MGRTFRDQDSFAKLCPWETDMALTPMMDSEITDNNLRCIFN